MCDNDNGNDLDQSVDQNKNDEITIFDLFLQFIYSENWDKDFAKVNEIAQRKIELNETISYEVASMEAGFPKPKWDWWDHQLNKILKAFDREDIRLGRPRRSTLFVQKGKLGANGQERTASRLPGNGYFKYFENQLGKQLKTAPEKREVFLKELDRLRQYYAMRK